MVYGKCKSFIFGWLGRFCNQFCIFKKCCRSHEIVPLQRKYVGPPLWREIQPLRRKDVGPLQGNMLALFGGRFSLFGENMLALFRVRFSLFGGNMLAVFEGRFSKSFTSKLLRNKDLYFSLFLFLTIYKEVKITFALNIIQQCILQVVALS